MGDIADQMLEGSMCQWCGEFIDDETGWPTVCAGCQLEHNVDQHGNKLPEIEDGLHQKLAS
ncbi:hypothetical protein LCGC14_2180040 [marine sediment metagenome]|uniref:Uncharacterized protein n=1 Tax=marine sediment metagenome TaxID=412755 RepID=A0A0F9DMJ6_9ZZZZ